jgi:hypothetical protein
VWRKGHRLRRLESEIAAGKAERADLRRRLELFETIAAAAGVSQQDPVPSAPMPPGLTAAARDLRAHNVPVQLDVAGTEVIAIIGGPGDPREWWTAIWHLAGSGAADQQEAQA